MSDKVVYGGHSEVLKKLIVAQFIKKQPCLCTQLHVNICRKIQVKFEKTRWYEHIPKAVQ